MIALPWPFVTATEGAIDAGLPVKAFYRWAERHNVERARIRVGRSTMVVYNATRLREVLDSRYCDDEN